MKKEKIKRNWAFRENDTSSMLWLHLGTRYKNLLVGLKKRVNSLKTQNTAANFTMAG